MDQDYFDNYKNYINDINSDKFKEFKNIFVNLRGNDLKYLYELLQYIDNCEDYKTIFGNDYWKYIRTYSGSMDVNFDNFISVYNPNNPNKFATQAEEYEYVNKLFLLTLTDKNIDVNLQYHEILMEIIIHDFSKKYLIKSIFAYNNYLSVNFINFIYSFIAKYPEEHDFINILFDNTSPELFKFDDVNVECLTDFIKNMTYEDIIACDRNVFVHYKMIRENKITVMKTFISCLDKSCDLNDTDDVIISKTSVKALINEIGDFVEN